ncbi:hypothetical protein L204_101269 [Cryptococcus depauperatus]
MSSFFRKKEKQLPHPPSVKQQGVSFAEFGHIHSNSHHNRMYQTPTTPPTPPDSPPRSPPPALPLKYSFCPTYIPPYTSSENSIDSFSYSATDVTGLPSYGFLGGIGSRITLGLGDVGRVILEVGGELERRALETPLLFSNQALELNQTRTRMLIQAFLGSLAHEPNDQKIVSFRQDLTFAKEYELAWLLRWALSRIARFNEGARVICRGVMEWEVYEEWRGRERAANYPADAFPFLSQLVPLDVYDLILLPLFKLLSKFAAHSHLSGLTPHALSSLFCPLLFDIPSSSPAFISHISFVRSAYATEHFLLAYIRSGAGTGSVVTDLPSRLKAWIANYPSMLPSDSDLAQALPRRGARLVRLSVLSRDVRAYTKDLVAQVEGWADEMELVGQKWSEWDRLLWKPRRGNSARPHLTNAWKRRMAVKSLPQPPSSATRIAMVDDLPRRSGSMISILSTNMTKLKDDDEEARYGSLAGKEWSLFEESGFSLSLSSSSSRKKEPDLPTLLQFDLSESSKQLLSARRQTMSWTEFASPSGGFNRSDPLLDATLTFSQPIAKGIEEWPKERGELVKRLYKAQKEAVPFEWNTTPNVGMFLEDCNLVGIEGLGGMKQDSKGRIYVEEAWVDVWCDLMMGSGWVDREELTFRESNWAIVEYKAKSSRSESVADPRIDPRTSSLYVLYEERVPVAYQRSLLNSNSKSKKGFTFFTPKSTKARKRQERAPPITTTTPLAHASFFGAGIGSEVDFERMLQQSSTKKVSLNKSRDQLESTAWHLSPNPSSSPYSSFSPVPLSSVKSSSLKGHRSRNHENDPYQEKSNKLTSHRDNLPSKEKKIKVRGKAQKEIGVVFEVKSAGGLSSTETSPLGGIMEDEKWMDILVESSRIPGQDVHSPIATYQNKSEGLPLYPQPLPASPLPPSLSQNDQDCQHTPIQRHRRMKQRDNSRDVEEEKDEEGGFEPLIAGEEGFPTPESFDLQTPPSRPLLHAFDTGGGEGIIHAPQPRRERDTIHGIVAQYSSSEVHDYECSSNGKGQYTRDKSANSSPESARDSERYDDPEEDEDGEANDHSDASYGILQPPKTEKIFDLTPGREPSPARYRHGEPLHFVGEEPEEE